MEEKTSIFSLMEQQASSLLLAVAGSYNLCEFVEKDEKRPRKKGRKKHRFFLDGRQLPGLFTAPPSHQTIRRRSELKMKRSKNRRI